MEVPSVPVCSTAIRALLNQDTGACRPWEDVGGLS